jgi:hypothetical protein
MRLTIEDRLEIPEVIALHGHLCDAGTYARFGEVFTSDLEVDASDLGLAPLRVDPSRPRLDTCIAAAQRRGPGGTLALHVTNVIVCAATLWSDHRTPRRVSGQRRVGEVDLRWRTRTRRPRLDPGVRQRSGRGSPCLLYLRAAGVGRRLPFVMSRTVSRPLLNPGGSP